MSKRRSWTYQDLMNAVSESRSIRKVLIALNLVPAGGNYVQVKRRIAELNIETAHFTGKGWNVGMLFRPVPARSLEQMLVLNGTDQSYQLKHRLFKEGIKNRHVSFAVGQK